MMIIRAAAAALITLKEKLAKTYPDLNFAAAAAKLPWGHNMVLLDSIQSNDQRIWYAKKTIENG